MPVEIKICGLTTPEAVDAAIEAGAEWLGFVFFGPSPRNLSQEDARLLSRHIGDRARKVALVVDAGDDEIAAIMEALRPDLIQFHGEEEPRRLAEIRSRYTVPVMKAIGVATQEDLARAEAYRSVADRILFDAKPPKDSKLPGGNGRPFDWTILAGLDLGKPYMLSGGLEAGNVARALAATKAPGVDVSSGVETRPGVKDAGKIAAFVRAVRDAEAS